LLNLGVLVRGGWQWRKWQVVMVGSLVVGVGESVDDSGKAWKGRREASIDHDGAIQKVFKDFSVAPASLSTLLPKRMVRRPVEIESPPDDAFHA